jgi:hypothetical protein
MLGNTSQGREKAREYSSGREYARLGQGIGQGILLRVESRLGNIVQDREKARKYVSGQGRIGHAGNPSQGRE